MLQSPASYNFHPFFAKTMLARFHALRDCLVAHDDLWRPTPFHIPRPDWCDLYPDLGQQLLSLKDEEVTRLAGDAHALIELLAHVRPQLRSLHELIALPRAGHNAAPPPAHLFTHVPGRKQGQITAFAQATTDIRFPILEWCAGKGHLGRLLGYQHRHPVASLEIDATLVRAGTALAAHAGITQTFLHEDALAASAQPHLAGHHAVALHACGELHLALLRAAVTHGAPALDLAPCCYYRIAQKNYVPLNHDADLPLSRDELHLAVTESITAGQRDRRQRDLARAWKLAFLEWRTRLGVPRGRTFKPVPGGWLTLGFDAWMRRLCQRELLRELLPEAANHDELEQIGWQRLKEVSRLELVRLTFRRPLEIWLALDRAVFLARHGYQVDLHEFCDPALTPRNLLISARRQTLQTRPC